jgi:Zn-dependent protease
LHELAHKVVAVQYGQVAAFRADYGMLALAIGGALAGIFFAAPGAVYHRGRITTRQNGLVAVAGPVTNLVLAVLFAIPFLLVGGFVGEVARLGVLVNLFLAAFNMIPFGPLDGKTVKAWDTGVFALVLSVSAAGLVGFLLSFGLVL